VAWRAYPSTGLRLVAIAMRPCGPDTVCRVTAATKNGCTPLELTPVAGLAERNPCDRLGEFG